MTTNKQMERAYITVRPTIIKVCKSFRRQYGGELDELVSEAHYHFVNIFLTHDPDRQDLEQDVAWRVFKRLLESRTKNARRRRLLNPEQLTEYNAWTEPVKYFDLEGFLNSLDGDAKQVVKAVLNEPIDVQLEIAQRPGGRTPTTTRRAVVQYLRDLRWSAQQIRQSFSAIREALTGD
jgi:hypothetical protein